MIPIESRHAGVAVVVSSPGRAGYLMFEASLSALLAPAGSFEARSVGASIAMNCNEIVRKVVSPPPQDSRAPVGHAFFVDDDHVFDPGLLMALLDREAPIVTALTCKKYPPFLPTVYKGWSAEDSDVVPYTWAELAGLTGTHAVHSTGRAGMLVSRDVLEAVGDPCFRLGQVGNPEVCHEDVDFCERARALGFPILADLDNVMGHVDAVATVPHRMADGTYAHRLTWWGGMSLMVRPKV